MNTKRWIVGGVAVLALAAALVWAYAPRPLEVETANVTQGPFETAIEDDAKTRLRERYVVAAPLAGVLSRVELREGDRVDAGAVIATLTPVLPALLDERTLGELRARLDTAQAQVGRAQAQSDAARVALTRARREAWRSEELAREGFVAAARLDGDRLAVQAAERELDAAAQARRVADLEVEQARAALAAVRAGGGAVRAVELRAPASGRVLRVAQTSETPLVAGTPLLEIGDTRRLEIVAELLTADALRAAPGSRVVVERWGGAPLPARVRSVEPAAFTKVSALGVEEQRVKVLIDLDAEPAAACAPQAASQPERGAGCADWGALGDGFRVGVRIVTRATDAALRVPVGALFPLPAGSDGGDGGMAVFALRDGRARLQPVQVEARNPNAAWVRQGLSAGDVVIVYPPPGVADGARVRARKV